MVHLTDSWTRWDGHTGIVEDSKELIGLVCAELILDGFGDVLQIFRAERRTPRRRNSRVGYMTYVKRPFTPAKTLEFSYGCSHDLS